MRNVWRAAGTITLLIVMAAGPAFGTYYHTDPNGDDGNPGTAEAPWRTIQHAANTLAPGDGVFVGAGVYVEAVVITRSGTSQSPIVYQGFAGAILESPDPSASLSAFDVRDGVSNLILDGFEIRGGYHETIYVRSGASRITIRNCDVHDNRVGIWINSANDIEIDGCYIHANVARGLRVAGSARAITVRNTESSANDDGWGCFGDSDGFTVEETASDVEFIGCVARNNAEDGFDIQGDDVRILRTEVRDNGCAGIKMGQNGRVENTIVSGNSLGISTSSYFNTAPTVEIVNSTVADNVGQQLYLKQPSGTPPIDYDVIVHHVIASGAGKAIEAAPAVVLTEHHNVLFRPDTSNPVIVQYLAGGGTRLYSGQDINAGIWTLETGQGKGTWAIAPDFADPNSYRVAAESVAIDSGDAANAPPEDIEGGARPQGLAFDIGAFEAANPLPNHRPWADPGGNRTKTVGQRVDFTAYGSADPDGDPITYSWDFGDGSPAGSGYAVSHTYTSAGEYPVTLTLSDGSLSRSRTAAVNVLPAPTQTPTVTPTPTGTLPPTPTATWSRTPTHTRTPEPTPTPITGSPCGAAPRLGCRAAGKTKFVLARSLTNESIRSLRWKWLRGATTNSADFGNPVDGATQYALCLFSTSETATQLVMSVDVPAGGTCKGKSCWQVLPRGGFTYQDRDRTSDGVARIVLKAGDQGTAKVVIAGAGATLPIPLLPLDRDARMTVQFVNSEGECWEGVYPTPADNRDTQFKAYSTS